MGIFGLGNDDEPPSERERLLSKLTLAQLKQLAAEHGVDVTPKERGLFDLEEPLRGKELYVARIARAKKGVPLELIKETVGERITPKEKVAKDKSVQPGMVTPTIASARTTPLVSFEDVVNYLERYKFISRYSDESYYEVELAGALREKFGTVTRQNPVAVAGKRLTIDLDVGGIGIEVKFDAGAVALRNAVAQLADYKQFYGEKLILLCVATPGADQYKNDVRNLGVILVEK